MPGSALDAPPAHDTRQALDAPPAHDARQPHDARRALAERLVRQATMPAEASPAEFAGPGPHPVTPAQQALWLSHRMQPHDVAYNLGCAVALESVVPAVLTEALQALTQHQAALRTCFLEPAAGERSARQHVHHSVATPLTVVDLRHLTGRAERADRLARLAAVHLDLPFDLRRAPLLRAMLVRGPGGEDVVLLATHHIVSDGNSVDLLARDLKACYRAALLGGPVELPELAEDFAAFARRQARLLDRDRERLSAWWRDYLDGAPTELALPLDYDRPPSPRNAGTWTPLNLDGERGASIRAFAAGAGVTPFALVLASYAAMLGRYAGVDDLLIGVPFSGRRAPADHDVIGLYVATLPLRVCGLGDCLDALARRVQAGLAEVLDHQHYPFEALLDEHPGSRDPGVQPLFQASAVHQPRRGGGQRERASGPGSIRFDLSLQLGEGPHELDGALGGRGELFQTATLQRLRDHLEILLDAGLRQPERPLSAVRLGEPCSQAAEVDPGGWRAELAALLAQRPGPRVRVGDERVEFSEVDFSELAEPGDSAAGLDEQRPDLDGRSAEGDEPALDQPAEQPFETGLNHVDHGAVTLVGLDEPRSVAAALTALATGRPVTLLDASWPQAWLARCRAEPAAAASGLRVGELGADGLPALVEVAPAAVGHAIGHATAALRLEPGASLAVGGLAPSVALLLGVLPAVLAGASVTLVPGSSRELLDLVAWDGPDAALVDRARAADLLREGWDASTHVLSHGDETARRGMLGPAALGHAAAAVLDGRASLLAPVRLETAGDESLAGAVGQCTLGTISSSWRARLRSDATLVPIAPTSRASQPSQPSQPSRTVAELETAGPALPDAAASDTDPLTAVVRLVSESCLGVPVPDLDQTFFELGGHSLLVTQLAAELTDLLGVQLGLGEVFRHPSVRALSGWLADRPDAAALTVRACEVLEVAALDDAEVLRRLGLAVRV